MENNDKTARDGFSGLGRLKPGVTIAQAHAAPQPLIPSMP